MRYNKHILLEGRLEDVKNFFKNQIGESWPYTEPGNPYHHFLQGVDLEERFQVFVDNDPSGNHKHLRWMVDTYLGEGGINPLDIYSVVQKFDANLSRLTPEFMYNQLSVSPIVKKSPKDINSYANINELEFIVDELSTSTSKRQKEKELKKEVDRVYEDDNWIIIRPKSHGASCYYGANTKWCTAMKNNSSQFDHYSKLGVLYYLIKKDSSSGYKIALFKKFPSLHTNHKTGKKTLDSPRDDEWFDMQDNRLNSRVGDIVTNMLPNTAKKVITDLYEKESKYYEELANSNVGNMSLNQFVNSITDKLRGQKIKFNTESGTWELEVSGRHEWYVKHTGDKIYTTPIGVELFVDGEYEIIVSDFDRVITPTEENDLVEGIGWYFRILPEKIVEASRRDGYKEVIGDRLGLPEKDRFKNTFLDKEWNSWVPRPEKSFLNNILLPNLRYLLSRPEIKEMTQEQKKLWEPNRYNTPLTFKYPPKEGSLTQLFVDFVKNNPGKTRKEFYDSIGRTYTPGHNSEFFAVINNSGIVKMERQGRQFVYTLGPNHEPWVRGELSRM